MIDITIKTLDSRNHSFTVEDQLTVKQLKEHIAEPVNVPAESQRLIYCGRVLADEKKLSEYDVDGKVIHLVQRAPPSANTDSGNNGSEGSRSSSAPSTTSRRNPFRAIIAPGGRMDGPTGNAMYLGAMAFPADLMDAQGISMPQPRHRLSQSRISIARAMLRRASYTLLNLENPSHQESPQETAAPSNERDELTRQIENAASAAIGIGIQELSSPSHVGVQHTPPIINIEATGGDGEMQAEDAEPTPEGNSPEEAAAPDDSSPNASAGDSNNRNGRYRFPGPVHMAELIQCVRDIERRLSPFLERFYDLVRSDPLLDNPVEAQRLYDQVSKMMHFMAHAYHAISDIMCDFSQPPPRRLRCRPVLIQHSAVLQTGIPIQAQLNIGAGTSSGSSNGSSTSSTQSNPGGGSQTAGGTAPGAEGSAAAGGEGIAAAAAAAVAAAAAAAAAGEAGGVGAEPAGSDDRPQDFGAHTSNRPSLNLGSGNIEFFMDVGQGSITIDSVEATVVTSSGQSGGNPESTNISSGPFPWGTPPPPEFLQNLVHALAGHMMGGSPTVVQSGGAGAGGTAGSGGPPPGAVTSSGAGGGPIIHMYNSGGVTMQQQAPGASAATSPPGAAPEANVTNSQARGNTATQPTTSTQTRSTTRPHVHISPGFQGMGVPGFFDPFLPCNSHHIHTSRRRGESGAATAAPAAAGTVPTAAGGEGAAGTSPTSAAAASPAAAVGRAMFSPVGVPAAPTQTNQQSTGTSTETPTSRTASEQTPPLVSLFSNLLSSAQGATLRGGSSPPGMIRILPRDVTVFLQGSPSAAMQSMTTLPINTTVAELLQSLPEQTLGDGSSIFTDFAMTLSRNLRVIDVLNMGSPNSSVLISLRPVLREYILNQLLGGQDTPQAVSEALNRINTELRPLLESLMTQDVPFRDDVDLVATVNQLNHTTIPILIRDVLDGDDSQFLRNIPNHVNDYARHLASIFLYCCENGPLGLDAIYTSIARRVIVGMPAILQRWSVVHIANQLRAITVGLEPSRDAIQPFLVFRMAEAPPDQPHPPPPPPESPQAMETDASPPLLNSEPPVDRSMADTPPLGAEQLPDVILGAEQWHNAVPADWVPIISRDRERQRRQAVQGPLSEAYLSGMPSKRRKVVTSNKPHNNLTRVITESMSTALGAAGVARAEGVSESAGADTTLRAAYREQVRATVGATLRSHPDFKPDKYPNAAKLFTPK